MATARDFAVGARTFKILIDAHVGPLGPAAYVARAFEGNSEVEADGGDPIELPASTESRAIARMEGYLSRRFKTAPVSSRGASRVWLD